MKEELKSSDFWEEMRAELRNEMQPVQNLFSPREDDVPNSVHMKSNLNSTTIMVRNEMQAQQNDSFSPRQEGNHNSVQMGSNLSSTKSIGRKEQQVYVGGNLLLLVGTYIQKESQKRPNQARDGKDKVKSKP
ncbi:hypothetical protein Tco_0575575, partial [Tanacetum coccineum]